MLNNRFTRAAALAAGFTWGMLLETWPLLALLFAGGFSLYLIDYIAWHA